VLPPRADFAALPRGWLAGVGAIWLGGFLATSHALLVPRPRTVLPDAQRVAWLAALSAAALLLAARIPGVRAGDTAVGNVGLCAGISLAVAAGVLLLVGGAVRRLGPISATGGAALGLAGGALGGLLLHFTCANPAPNHVTVAHAAPALLWAALGAVAARVTR
jgi:hypothetical protein